MDHLNSLPSTNAATSSVPVHSRTCGTCSSGTDSFANVLKDEQQGSSEKEAAPTTASNAANSLEQTPLTDLATLAANDSPSGEQGDVQTALSEVEESYDSVLQLLSELNAAPTNQIKIGDASLVANNDLTPLTPAGLEGDVTISTNAPQNTQPTPLSQDNQIQSLANPIAGPGSGAAIAGSASASPAQQIDAQTNPSTNPQATPLQSAIGATNGTAQSEALNGPGELAAQSLIVPENNSPDTSTTPLNAGSVEAQNAPVGNAVGTESKLVPTTPETQQSVKAAQSLAEKTPSSETNTASGTNKADQAQSTSAPNNEPASSGQQGNEGQSSSLMQRLKPLDQATPLFQAQGGAAQDALKTLDIAAPALTMNTTGEIARPAGLSGIIPSLNTPATPQVPIDNIAVHIAAQAKAGNQRFNIRLDPPELGRIDIRLEIGRDGQTLTHIAVDKPETLDLLRQDSRSLERALNSAGLESREGGLSFSLREENKEGQQDGEGDQDGEPSSSDNSVDENEHSDEMTERTLNVSSGLDIKI